MTGIGTGALAGLVNGTLISRMKIPPFIATLGIMMVARGLALIISGVKPIYMDAIPGFPPDRDGHRHSGLRIPNAVLILFLAALIAAFILSRTVMGRYDVAIGSNEEATRLSGVNVAAWKTGIYTLGGMFSGLAA